MVEFSALFVYIKVPILRNSGVMLSQWNLQSGSPSDKHMKSKFLIKDTLYTSEKGFDVGINNPTEMEYMTEKGDNVTAESLDSTETEEFEQQGQWSDLPSPPLERIYSLLYRNDQVNMSLVCRKWSEGYRSPSVWKTFHFDMTESQVLMDTCSVMKFARKYSSMFRHVEIFCTISTNKHLIYTWCRHFIEFLQILTSNSQLISVKFLNLVVCFAYMDSPTCGVVCTAIVNFLGLQHHLKRVEFYRCLFGFKECAEVLKEITENSRESLRHLVLRGFVRNDPMDKDQDSNVAEIIPTIVGLPSLTTLETDYSLIFENMFARQSAAIQTSKNRTRLLSKIVLNYDNDSMKIEDFRGLKSADWRCLKRLYPDLQVEFNLTSDSPSWREVEFFIVPNMPITWLNYAYEKINLELHQSSLIGIDVLLDHLLACKANDHLVSLHLKWVLPIPDISSIFIPFLQACKKLKCMDLSIVYPANGIVVLMQSWLKNRPDCLEEVHIAISDLKCGDDTWSFMSLMTEYKSLLGMVGLNLNLDFIFGRGRRLI
ncbi:hypothetical protein AVEN_18953-1 [Araneus ventricosus]|uniref:F-box domain-containing protein n=1 Tax=Araneus ventricosus TaxID=182803 RepID=A0A4Y2QZ80_ARAVE|nr:hypothetical protein AVEN_18953-1 [Araneus ventricosus]